MPISKFSTLTEMKDYVRKNNLNKGDIRLNMKKSVMLAALDKGGHIHTGARGADAPKKKATPKKATKLSKKEEWEKLKKMPQFMKWVKTRFSDNFEIKKKYDDNDYMNQDIVRKMGYGGVIPKNRPLLWKELGKDFDSKELKQYIKLTSEEEEKQAINVFAKEVFDKHPSVEKFMKFISS